MSHFMALCLTHPELGYYMSRDVFGTKGDFTTSPEISQIFGELIAVFLVNYWQQNGSPHFDIVELGPGRGTLMLDILRTFSQFKILNKLDAVRMVDASPFLQKAQRALLAGYNTDTKIITMTPDELREHKSEKWTLYIAHEFFDALPVYQFKKTEQGWREMMVDAERDESSPYHFRHALSREKTKANLLVELKNTDYTKENDIVQVSPATSEITAMLAKRVQKNGGAAFIVDYGTEHVIDDRVRGIREHEWTSVFSMPGKTDLSTDVEFCTINEAAEQSGIFRVHLGAAYHGLLTQGHFLKMMGIGARLMKLVHSTEDEKMRKDLVESAKRLVDSEQMGRAYQMCVITPKGVETPYPFCQPDPAHTKEPSK